MDYSQYENYGFDRFSAFNMSTGYEERSYQAPESITANG